VYQHQGVQKPKVRPAAGEITVQAVMVENVHYNNKICWKDKCKVL
jgi:hypothetical protein